MSVELKDITGQGMISVAGTPAVYELKINDFWIAYLAEDAMKALRQYFATSGETTLEEFDEQVSTVAPLHLFARMALAAARRPDMRAAELLDMFAGDLGLHNLG